MNLVKRFFVILLILLVFEIVFRIFNTENFKDDNIINDVYLGHVLKPYLNTTIYNADGLQLNLTAVNYDGIGLRDDKVQNPYIIAIGDSHTLGLAVNSSDTWVNLLEKKLGKEILNMGVHSYGTIQEERMLERYGLKLNPKIILWQFSGNDFIENYRFLNKDLDLKQFLINNVAIAKFVWSKLGQIKHNSLVVRHNDENLSFVFEPYSYLNSVEATDEIKIGVDLGKKAFIKAQELIKNKNAALIMVLIPSKEEIYFNMTNNYQMNSMRNLCKELNLNCFDMTESFNAQAKMHKQLYFPIDAHLNILGNEVVADVLYGYLKNNNFVG